MWGRERGRLSEHNPHQIAARDEMIAGTTRRIVSRAPQDRCRDAFVWQAPVTELDTDDAAQPFQGRLLRRIAKFGHGDLGLRPQHVCLAALFRELAAGCACFLRPASHVRWDCCAAVEMGANAVGQVRTALRAQIRVGAREKFVRPDAPGARHALPYGVVPAVLIEQSLLVEGEPARPTAVKMDHAIAVEFDGVRRRDHLPASETRRIRCHLNRRELRSRAAGPTSICEMIFTPIRGRENDRWLSRAPKRSPSRRPRRGCYRLERASTCESGESVNRKSRRCVVGRA